MNGAVEEGEVEEERVGAGCKLGGGGEVWECGEEVEEAQENSTVSRER